MKYLKKGYSGNHLKEANEREQKNRNLARKAAAESMVLFHNDGILPLDKETPVAIFGSGAANLVIGGKGSGDVNEREVVNIDEGMKNAGFIIANEKWLADYREEYAAAREAWRVFVVNKAAASADPGHHHALIDAYIANPFQPPGGNIENYLKQTHNGQDTQIDKTALAIYVLSRNAGEGADRKMEKGDYFLTEEELSELKTLNHYYRKTILLLNCGGPIDLRFTREIALNAILYICQPGMEGGNAVAEVLSGKVSPCGKLTDTWAERYEDYPNAMIFSHRDGNVWEEYYQEGIYVGYRYFDTFQVKPFFPFGYGLSYTDFEISAFKVALEYHQEQPADIVVQVRVQNIGAEYSGKEVVQLYVSCPQQGIKKEYQRLCAFGKTPVLAPGEKCFLELRFPIPQLTSFYESAGVYRLEQGDYVIAVGGSSRTTKPAGILKLSGAIDTLKVSHICPLPTESSFRELEPERVPSPLDKGSTQEARNGGTARETIKEKGLPVIVADPDRIPPVIGNGEAHQRQSVELDEAARFVETLTVDQLIALTSGDPGKGQDASSTFGSSGLSVPGAAGETHDCASEAPWGLAGIVLADGPAGLRLAPDYQVALDGGIIKPGFADTIEGGLFAKQQEVPGSTRYYQYCTAFPVGTMLAQSWDTGLLAEVGRGVAVEMEEFRVTLWLAPGMNIHRNPLCGRNFEYFSEDPLLSGVLAAAITEGVQSRGGTGTTIKHFACNNQEENRKHSSSILSERALREIYLHGFEIAVKHAQPMAMMTSYNLLNGVHTANSYDLITKVAREEWGFAGFVMTDWTTTGEGGSSPIECMKAGNDLIMPGSYEDLALLRLALDGGELELGAVKKCVANLVRVIWKSLEYENSKAYSSGFDLKPYISCTLLPGT